MRQKFILGLLIALSLAPSTFSQRSKLNLVKEGMDYIYNQEFQKAQKIIEEVERSLPRSAIPDLMKATQVFWQHYPVHLKVNKLAIYQNYLERSYSRSLEVLESDPGNPEAIFLALASQGLLAESYADAGRSFKAIGAAKRAYNYIKDSNDKLDQFREFYLSTGLYNYYREYYPEANPIYRPFMYFFMKGNKQLGIQQLEIAANNAFISHVIAKYYLSYIYMRYEYLPSKALNQGKNLHESYPNNDLFSAIYLESLIINEMYKEAIPLANRLQSNSNPYLRIYGDLFMGVIEERGHKNYQEAERLYQKSLKLHEGYDMSRAHLEAYAYLGLGRIYEQKKDPKAKEYFKESLDRAYTKSMKNEVKSHLN